MDLPALVKVVKRAIVDSGLVISAFTPQELHVGKGNGVIMAQLPDGTWAKLKVSILAVEVGEE